MLLEVDEVAHAADVVSLRYHDQSAHLELENLGHLAGGDVDLDGIIHLDFRVGIAKSPAIVGHGHGNLLGGDVNLLDATQLVLGLVLLDFMQDEPSLGIVEQTEEIAGLLEGDDVHETRGVVVVSSHLAVDLDATLHANLLAFLPGQGVLETLAQDDGDGEALALLVGSGGGLGRPDAAHLAEIPVSGRIEALEVLLRSASHGLIVTSTGTVWRGG